MLEHLARESGIETPTAEDLARLDLQAQGQEVLSNEDWVFEERPRIGQIAKMKDGTTHLAVQARARGMDLDTGAVVALPELATRLPTSGDTTTLPKTSWRRPRRTLRALTASATDGRGSRPNAVTD